MGRGRGNDPRTVLLGRQKINRTLETLVETTDGHGESRSVYVDAFGRRIVRPYKDRKRWVEEIENDYSLVQKFIYTDTLDYDLLGDSTVIKQVDIGESEGEIESYFYSDNKTLLVRDIKNRDTPVSVLTEDEELISRTLNWRSDDDPRVFEEEIFYYSGTSVMNSIYCKIDGKKETHEGNPAVKRFYPGGQVEMEEYWYNDSLESIDDEPSTIEYNKEGQAITHRWYDADRNLHRVGAPALVHFDPETEMAVEHEYWTNGVHTNPDGPAYIQFFPRSETAETKVWTSVIKSKNSKGDEVDVLVAARPEGKPGKEVYHRNGLIKEQAWFNYSDPTKVNLNYYSPSNTNDKPAQITFTTDGKRETVSYFLDGSLHRIGGPAFVEYSSEGKTLKQDFYLNGGEVTKERAMEAAKNG